MIETVKHYPEYQFTIASIYDPESGEMRFGVSFVAPGDHFVKKVGYQKAMGRAVSSNPIAIRMAEKNLGFKGATAYTEKMAGDIVQDDDPFISEIHNRNLLHKEEKEIEKLQNQINKHKKRLEKLHV